MPTFRHIDAGGRRVDASVNGLWYALSGLAAGVLAGMGMGGGTLLIPLLTLALGVGQQEAQGVNMLAFLPGAILACGSISGRAVFPSRAVGRCCFWVCWDLPWGLWPPAGSRPLG